MLRAPAPPFFSHSRLTQQSFSCDYNRGRAVFYNTQYLSNGTWGIRFIEQQNGRFSPSIAFGSVVLANNSRV
jgi:hypothetical protein